MLLFEGFKILAWKTWICKSWPSMMAGRPAESKRTPQKMGLSQMVVRLMVMFISWDSESRKKHHQKPKHIHPKDPQSVKKKHPRLSHR